jgi:hypothetical protein
MQRFSGNFDMTRRQFVASLTVLYTHKFPNSKFEGDILQGECFARVEKGFISVIQPDLY